eukprot:Blabericola_migrator_1__2907@NODE_1836_length_3711_cov_6_593030_g1176_i0_p5_GENE_NODE_1836_length_3711_cov_6_593030_g1176_i0NODE_1836_length_3711_cov_6_593030_g1176_i0_p5_ORF_typecomplete_len136_score14_14_NODE_1836_length_3711_cov_6_593030_g1176_i019592366
MAPEMLQFMTYLRTFGLLTTDFERTHGRRKLPIMNVPKVIAGCPQFLDKDCQQVAMTINPLAIEFCANYNLPTPAATEYGEVYCLDGDEDGTRWFLPVLDSKDPVVLEGFNGHPLMVPVPVIYAVPKTKESETVS